MVGNDLSKSMVIVDTFIISVKIKSISQLLTLLNLYVRFYEFDLKVHQLENFSVMG